ncbi:MAG TPA: hypothetical protein VFJ43_05220, partial [Bacteroidia bacterium]|nr:hypothetical protein [Bacteroidia bacterium]
VPALQSSVINPDGLAISPDGNLVFVDSGHEVIRLVTYAQNNLGHTLYKGPLGYYDSQLQRESDGTWIRKYKNGNTVIFDANGHHVQSKDKNGNETVYQYGSNQELVRIDYPGNSYLQFRYDNRGIINEIEDHVGRINRFTVVDGTLVKANLVDFCTLEFNYDPKGRITSRKEANGLLTEYVYNDYGRVVQKISNGEGGVSIDRPDDRYAGNEAANNTDVVADSPLTNIATSDGQNVAYQADTSSSTIVKNNRSFDSFSNSQMLLGRSQRPNGTTVDYSYDDDGNLLQLVDSATGGIERSEYDEKGQRILHVNALGRITRWSYDEAGNVIEKRVGNNSLVSSWQYNANGLVSHQSANGVTTLFNYDEHGNVSSVQQGDLITLYQRDASGNVIKKTEGSSRNLQYEYNLLNWLVKVSSPLGEATSYEYNMLGNITSVIDSLGNKTLFE